MTGLLPNAKQRFFDTNGLPLAGGSVTTYTPGTTTYSTTYANSDLSTANTNPMTLDANGYAPNQMWGNGLFRQIVKDALGNLIWDAVTSTETSDFTVSAAMRAIVNAATVNNALTLLGESGDFYLTDGDLVVPNNDIKTGKVFRGPAMEINPAGQTLTVQPTANPTIDTLASLSVQGTTSSGSDREFLVNFGLSSDKGEGSSDAVDGGKVTLYCGFDGKDGTGNGWALNTCATATAGSGDYILQSIEVDTNNFVKARGTTGKIFDSYDASAFPIYGIQVTGIGTYPCTAGIMITGATANSNSTTPQWARSLATSGYVTHSAWHDMTAGVSAIQFDGNYTSAALDFTAKNGNAGAAAAGGAMFMKNGMALNWQSADKSKAVGDYLDNFDVRVIGQNSLRIASGANMTPITSGAYDLGGDGFSWKNLFCQTIYPAVDATYDIGSSTFQWNDAYILNSVASTSDITKKNNVQKLSSMTEIVKNIEPISFKWNKRQDGNPGARTHLGFAAHEVKQAFDQIGMDAAAYLRDEQGTERLRLAELIPVLWQAVREVMDRLAVVETKTA